MLHFPDLLTSADLRARYPLPAMRALIQLTIGVAFLSSCLNLLLRPRKTLGLAGLALTLAAVILGGADVEIRGDFDRPVHFGLDWFLLNLLVFALVFVPLERAFPLKPGQRVLRAGWTTDVAYFFVNHVGIQLLTFLSLWPAMALAQALGMTEVSRLVSSQPVWLQVLELMLLADLVQYWVHRAFHRLPWLWRFHAIHHSIREMDWLAGSRLHLGDVVVTRALVVLPAFVLGFAEPALYAWLVIIALHGVLNHVNMRFRLRPARAPAGDAAIPPLAPRGDAAGPQLRRAFSVARPPVRHALPAGRSLAGGTRHRGPPGADRLRRAVRVPAAPQLNPAVIGTREAR